MKKKKSMKKKKKMKESMADNDGRSLSDFPDGILLEILNKVSDLKELCKCKLISKHIHSLVLQVDTISLTLTLVSARPYPDGPCYHSLSTKQMNKFTRLKSLSVHVPISPFYLDANSPFFKWKVRFDKILKSFVFISPTSIYDNTDGIYVKGNGNEGERLESFFMIFRTACNCLEDVNIRLLMLFGSYAVKFPLLQNILITDSVNGGVLSFTGNQVIDLFNSVPCHHELLNMQVHGPHRKISECVLPLLELPLSGYVMKNVALYLFERKDIPDDGDYSFITSRLDPKDKLEAAYAEAMLEILKNRRGQMQIMP